MLLDLTNRCTSSIEDYNICMFHLLEVPSNEIIKETNNFNAGMSKPKYGISNLI